MIRLIVSVVLMASAASAACLGNLNGVVTRFTFQGGSRVEAALAFGSETGLCLGMRNLPRAAFVEQANFDIREESPAQILRAIFADQEIQISMSKGIVSIFRAPSTASLFDRPIGNFTVTRASLQTLSVGIRLRLEHELHPEIQGFAGRFAAGDEADLVGPFDERGATVAQLLDLIVSSSRGASWIALVPDQAAIIPVPPHMWVVLEYDRPTSDYKALLGEAASNYPEEKTTK